ncbi:MULTISPECIES: mannitol dehydrogenase family protein [unclassified Pantoea]|uniref:mannitol dehydrogenase family protein n=1 Tax=unclassified Pantoea TaxID=2630326 RepID=UPI0023D9C607|nr:MULTISPECIES: mannitol dehydrogenase family protein [unclassified Pantoea]MDF2043542.1 mannitol dehydrogenase family protein [Pantoea sp. Cr_R14]MDF2070517.1 mannitol dehydrogenase family protein [Pantoea sp. Cr_R13]MDF2077888.1 mannitol dehydrogenase family protein [Pantoea sp. Cr_R21]
MLQIDRLPAEVQRPTYDRSNLKTRMVHIGFGAFHRAHQALCSDKLAEQGSDWGYCEVNLNSGDLIQALREQNLLYTLTEMADDSLQTRVIGVITQALHGKSDGIEAVINAMSQPEVAIVSMTVTEKGYCHQPASGNLNPDHPDIVHDLQNPDSPRSLPGLILAAIRRRRKQDLPAFSVMSCDNMPENGHVIRNVIVQLAQYQDPALADYIQQHITFPSTMVDRIVPAMTDAAFAALNVRLGCSDPVAVEAEPFFQWVIEDNFVNGRPAWEKAGAELVSDVLPYEEMKLRMLNGSHSFLAYLGFLAGYEYISDCMADPHFRAAARSLMVDEQAPTLRTQGVELNAYADSLIARYENRAIKHRTGQIATDGTQKLPQRMLDSLRWHLQRGSDCDLLLLGVAGWMRYVGGIDEKGQPIEIRDPMKAQLAECVASSEEGEARVRALLSMREVFGDDLAQNADVVGRLTAWYNKLATQGARATVHQCLNRS